MQKSVGELMQKLASETSKVIMCPFQVYIQCTMHTFMSNLNTEFKVRLIGILSM